MRVFPASEPSTGSPSLSSSLAQHFKPPVPVHENQSIARVLRQRGLDRSRQRQQRRQSRIGYMQADDAQRKRRDVLLMPQVLVDGDERLETGGRRGGRQCAVAECLPAQSGNRVDLMCRRRTHQATIDTMIQQDFQADSPP